MNKFMLILIISVTHVIHCEEEPIEFAESSDFSVDLSTLVNVSDEESTESSSRPHLIMENKTIEERGNDYEKSKLSNQIFPDSNYSNSTSVEYEDIESIESSCQSRRYTYQPKGLNNIYNEYTRVVNNGSFIQSINIEQCFSRTENCNYDSIPPLGKKYICKQKFVEITLKAYEKDTNMIVDQQFYYPSHCVCELVKMKKRRRKYHHQNHLKHKKKFMHCTIFDRHQEN